MIYLETFRMPSREAEEDFFSNIADPRNRRTCYTTKYPFHVFRYRQRTVLRRESRLENLLAHLAEQPVYAYTYTQETANGPQAKCLRCVWLDQEGGTLLITLGNAR